MNKYLIDFVDERTGRVLETWTLIKEQNITSHDFKNITHNLFMYAAISWEYAKLSAYVYKNYNPCFYVECKTINDGNVISADIFVNTRYVYTKIIAG